MKFSLSTLARQLVLSLCSPCLTTVLLRLHGYRFPVMSSRHSLTTGTYDLPLRLHTFYAYVCEYRWLGNLQMKEVYLVHNSGNRYVYDRAAKSGAP